MFNKKSNATFGVIGLGRFGFALAKKLTEAGKDVIAIDIDEKIVRQMREYTDNAFVINDLDQSTLEETGIQNCETVAVCVGEKIDTSILLTLNIINMGIPRVLARAVSPEQGRVLEKLGAEVVFPERDMAVRTANKLLNSRALDFITLQGDATISELTVTEKIAGQTLAQANLRKRFKINVIATENNGETITELTADTLLTLGAVIVVIGQKEHLKEFEEFLSK
ncbi:MAG: TrkA family potassium uptake protein [Clostridiales bacterium]|nr:TrkA family potassium uptake protein [Clostridiales bacterium]